ncbi:MAG: STAS domain-containing protein [Nitrospirae bacterium]|uniref:STAS domain-containing protein n=1 Tax=Candidatus Magnetobacterium casense TaxID=1455061 RepID=UPI000590503D|nr:STAS domain-containing protein [Candidatus Magnetobacterium casensis]MBF0338466.1 STAS domain-containing protein [Nitrospirota bacterium]
MEILTSKKNNATIMAIKGSLDSSTARQFASTIEQCMANGETRFIINVSGLKFISSAGLSSFIAPAKKLQGQGGKLLFVAMTERIERIFKMAGFYNTLFSVYDSEETALKYLE